MTFPTALAAPVLAGMMFAEAQRPARLMSLQHSAFGIQQHAAWVGWDGIMIMMTNKQHSAEGKRVERIASQPIWYYCAQGFLSPSLSR